MDRLTENVFGNIQLKACGNDFCKETCAEHDEEKSCNNCPIQKAFEKLAEYEGLEEQGKLLKLHCAVGDTVYCIMTSIKGTNPTIFSQKFDYSMIESFGKSVFLAREEAEAALKEMSEWQGKDGEKTVSNNQKRFRTIIGSIPVCRNRRKLEC